MGKSTLINVVSNLSSVSWVGGAQLGIRRSFNAVKMADQNRARVVICGLCGERAKDPRRINEQELHLLRKMYSDYNLDDPHYPTVLCCVCRLKNLPKQRLPANPPNFMAAEILLPRRSNVSLQCGCWMCLKTRKPGRPTSKISKIRGRPAPEPKEAVPNDEDPMAVSSSRPSSSSSSTSVEPSGAPTNEDLPPISKRARTSSNSKSASVRPIRSSAAIAKATIEEHVSEDVDSPEPKSQFATITLCKCCFQQIDGSEMHLCQEKNIATNLQKVVSMAPEVQKQLLVSKLLAEENNTGSEKMLTTGGRPKKLSLGHIKADPPRQMSIDTLVELQKETSSSNINMQKFIAAMHKDLGQKSTPAYARAKVSSKGHTMYHLYREEKGLFVTETDKRTGEPTVWEERPFVCGNLAEIVHYVQGCRGNESEKFITKIMADGGGKFFKIGLSIVPKKSESQTKTDGNETDKEGDEQSDEEDSVPAAAGVEQVSKKGQSRKKSKECGVNKMILLAIVPQIMEHRLNIELLFEAIGIGDIPMKFVSDLKMISIVNGLQGSRARHPCMYCTVKQDDLINKGHLRTFGRMRKKHAAWVTAGANKRKGWKEYENCKYPPILSYEHDGMLVLIVMPPPELHLLLGVVNTVFEGLVRVWGLENAISWAVAVGVSRESYHGNTFEGGPCRTLIKPKNIAKLQAMAPPFIQPVCDALLAFDRVVTECFGMKYDSSVDHAALCEDFKQKYLEAGSDLCRVTPKVHCVFHHVSEFIALEKDSLGRFGEQAIEASHQKWQQTWSRFEVLDFKKEGYSKNLRRAVCEFSSKRL